MPSKHDTYVQELVEQLEPRYDSLETNVLIYYKKRVVAEIDILAKKNDTVHVYEVKCSYRISKARKQMKKLQKHVPHALAFFYCGDSRLLTVL
ncbi:MAG: hypothetical protein ACMXYC_02125 [Candidatus Woesearchaeota archaeon]